MGQNEWWALVNLRQCCASSVAPMQQLVRRSKTPRGHNKQWNIISIYSEIFGHHTIFSKSNLAGKTRHTSQFINLIKQKNLLLTQYSSTVDPQEQAGLRKLLAPIKGKIRNFCNAAKRRKKRWFYKKLQEKFNKNPYQAGKELLGSTSDVKLTVDQLALD